MSSFWSSVFGILLYGNSSTGSSSPSTDIQDISRPDLAKIPGAVERRLYKKIKWQDEYGGPGWSRVPATVGDAEVVSSELVHQKLHAPALDIDIPAWLIPSSTPGHQHLYMDVAMPWRRYKRLLKALAKAGIIEKGYAKASIRRRHTAVRVPWLKKPALEPMGREQKGA